MEHIQLKNETIPGKNMEKIDIGKKWICLSDIY